METERKPVHFYAEELMTFGSPEWEVKVDYDDGTKGEVWSTGWPSRASAQAAARRYNKKIGGAPEGAILKDPSLLVAKSGTVKIKPEGDPFLWPKLEKVRHTVLKGREDFPKEDPSQSGSYPQWGAFGNDPTSSEKEKDDPGPNVGMNKEEYEEWVKDKLREAEDDKREYFNAWERLNTLNDPDKDAP